MLPLAYELWCWGCVLALKTTYALCMSSQAEALCWLGCLLPPAGLGKTFQASAALWTLLNTGEEYLGLAVDTIYHRYQTHVLVTSTKFHYPYTLLLPGI